LVAGLHQIDLARDVIGQEGDTFEFYATCLVAAVVNGIHWYLSFISHKVHAELVCTTIAPSYSAIPLLPLYAVEFKAPHKVTTPELVAGLHQIDLARDVIGQEKNKSLPCADVTVLYPTVDHI
jgi:hypothetical protein